MSPEDGMPPEIAPEAGQSSAAAGSEAVNAPLRGHRNETDGDTAARPLEPLSAAETKAFRPEESEETLISARRDSPRTAGDLPARIVVISHPDPAMLGHHVDLGPDGEIVLGRSADAEISLGDLREVSRRHARVFRADGAVWIEDLGSRNGTFVGGERISGRTRLNHGDQFSVADVHFRIVSGSDIEQAFHEAMYSLVMLDELTQIFNRRKYEQEAERDFARAIRHQRSLSVLVFDVDDFKEINDRYGHPAGDAVLRQIAALVSQHLRKEEVFSRAGGDEFVILCPEVGTDGARVLAERVRQKIAGHEFRVGGHVVRATCSFGLAELTPAITSPEALYAAADAQLYAAKTGGRNRVCG